MAEAPTVELRPHDSHDSHDSPHDSHDSFDEILRRVVAPAASPALLDVGSELVGRFRITRVLGAGGMGTVYVARDTTLGRDVAIKVHHAAGGAQRLRREAMAMARLAHPNVVTVFEVGELAGRPFVVMEYIAGTTLRAHLAAAQRSVNDILALLLAAGEGLAAAHDAGLVHRDIKPENVLVGGDGRARVGDFGLARELDTPDEASGAASEPADIRAPMTQTGSVMGTPAYMAPEQFAGAPVDARADQFAFCVTAWEALWRERPFAGGSFAELSAAITRGERRQPPQRPRLPARVRAALERGLAVDPADRFPSMRLLLAAIRPPRRRRRRWLAAGSVLVLVLAGLVAARWLGGGRAPSCDAAGATDLAGLRGDLGELLRQRGAAKIAARVEPLLHDYAATFRGHAQQACRAAREREWSPDIAARSRQCFSVIGRTAALVLRGADPSRPLDVLRRARRLPPVEQCRNPGHLASRPPLPGDPAQLGALTEANALLALGFDSIEDHDPGELRRALAALEASPARADPGIAAGLPVLRGWVAFEAGQRPQATRQLTDAYYAGRAIDDDQISSVALGLLVERGDELGLPPAAVQDWLRTALADADRIRARSPWLAGRVYTVAARTADLAGDPSTALVFVTRAREVLGERDPSRIETYATEGSARMASGHVADGIQAYEQAIAQRTAYSGADSPELAALLSDYASSLLDAQHLQEATLAAERASQIIASIADPDDDRIDPVRVTLAAVMIGANEDERALGLLETARAHSVRRLGEASTMVATIEANLATIYNGRGEHDRAIAALRSALAIDEKLLGPDRLEVATVLYNLGAAYRFKHDYPAAITACRRAAAIFAATSPGSDRQRLTLTLAASAANDAHDVAQALELTAAALGFPTPAEGPMTAAWGQLERARALIAAHRAAEARPLLEAARATYATLGMAERVQQADALIRQLPRAPSSR